MEKNLPISQLIEFIRKTKGASSAKTFIHQFVKPFLESINGSYSEEALKKLDDEMKCINPNCQDKNLTFHHLYPKIYRHDRINNIAIPERQEGVLICRTCHNLFHDKKTNLEIFEGYVTRGSIINFFKLEVNGN